MNNALFDTVVFDLGNVLIPFNPRWLFRKLLRDEASIDRFFDETGFDAWNLEMDAGRAFADGIAAHSRRWLGVLVASLLFGAAHLAGGPLLVMQALA